MYRGDGTRFAYILHAHATERASGWKLPRQEEIGAIEIQRIKTMMNGGGVGCEKLCNHLKDSSSSRCNPSVGQGDETLQEYL